MIMKTWNDYKEHVRTVDPEIGKDIDEVTSKADVYEAYRGYKSFLRNI